MTRFALFIKKSEKVNSFSRNAIHIFQKLNPSNVCLLRVSKNANICLETNFYDKNDCNGKGLWEQDEFSSNTNSVLA